MQEMFRVFIWMCALGAAVAIPMSVRKSRALFAGWLTLYFVAYYFLTSQGRYVEDLSSYSHRWMPMSCEKIVMDGTREIPTLNMLGAFFSPLLFVDRLAVHQSKAMTEGHNPIPFRK